jgi:hypothetical protein
MPQLTFQVKLQLQRSAPRSELALEATSVAEDGEQYAVFVDRTNVGCYTIRRYGDWIERNFFCCVPLDAEIPPQAIEQGTFGWGGACWQDRLRITLESLWVAAFGTPRQLSTAARRRLRL